MVVKKTYKKLSEYLYEFNRLMRKISDLIHEFGEEIYIEVKSTCGVKRNNFEISENEIEAARYFKKKYFIYHVVNSPKNPRIDGFIQNPINKICRKEIIIEPLNHKIRF